MNTKIKAAEGMQIELLFSVFLFFGLCNTSYNKQLLDEVFVICRITNVEVRVINNSDQDIDNLAYHKNRIQ